MNDPAEPIGLYDQLAGRSGRTKDLLDALDDIELRQQALYYRRQREHSTGQESYQWTKQLAAVRAVQEQRLSAEEVS